MKTSKYNHGKCHGDFMKRDPKDLSSNFEAVVSDKRALTNAPCHTVSIVFGNVRQSKRNPWMNAIGL